MTSRRFRPDGDRASTPPWVDHNEFEPGELVAHADLAALDGAKQDAFVKQDWTWLAGLWMAIDEAGLRRSPDLSARQPWLAVVVMLHGPPHLAAEMLARQTTDSPGALLAHLDSQNAHDAAVKLGWHVGLVAQEHSWREIQGFLHEPWLCALVAQERMLRGEDMSQATGTHWQVLGLPLTLQTWEPQYLMSDVSADHRGYGGGSASTGHNDAPYLTGPLHSDRATPGTPLARPRLVAQVAALAAHWSGLHDDEVAVVRGGAAEAIAALGVGRQQLAPMPAARALAMMAGVVAGGGAYGPSSCVALGRYQAWKLAAALTDLTWPPDPGELGDGVANLSWYVWEDEDDDYHYLWDARIAVADTRAGWAAAFNLVDDD